MELFKNNKEAAVLDSGVAIQIISTTVNLLTKSMNLLDVDPDSKSAIFNIHHGFKDDIRQCQNILNNNVNISTNEMRLLKEIFNKCEQRRISYCLKHKDR